MKELKFGYTPEEIAKSSKEMLQKKYEDCRNVLQRVKEYNEKSRTFKNLYDVNIVYYRIKSVQRVLEYIRSKKITDPVRLDTLLCHCQNKLSGNIDGTELDLSEDDEEGDHD